MRAKDEPVTSPNLLIQENREPDSNVTPERSEHPEKQFGNIFSTEAGMQIDARDEQFQNAPSPMQESWEPDSKMIVESDRHSPKQLAPSFRTDEGIRIDGNEEQSSNAWRSMQESCEPNSNVIDERDPHPAKHIMESCTTEDGIQIDERDEQRQNAESPIHEISQTGSNVTAEMPSQSAKHPVRQCLMPFQIVTLIAFPKYFTIDSHVKSTTICSRTLKLRLPSSIKISRGCQPNSAKGSIDRSAAGKQIDELAAHWSNMHSSMIESRDSGSNVMIDRDQHPEKHLSQSRSTDAGMQIDESAQ
jgi:hypothetical protein